MDPISSTSQIKAEVSGNFQINQTLKTINSAIEMNKILTEQFEWKRQELLKDLDALNLNLNDECDGNDEQLESYLKMANTSIPIQKRNLTLLLSNFLKPYLCDDRGLSAPLLFNPEHDYVLESHIQLMLINPCHNRRWTKMEEKIVCQQVRAQHLFKQTSSIVKRLEELLELSDRTSKQVEEIQKLNSDLAFKKIKHEEPERFSSEIDWLIIAKHLADDDRTDEDCELYYNNYLHSSINRDTWTPEEDAKLLELVEKHGESKWDLVSEQLQTGRLPWQCCSRYQSEFNPSLKRAGPIIGEEAKQLNELIEQSRTAAGHINWKQVNRIWEGRLLGQIKHFYNKQQSNIYGRSTWTRLEDNIIYAGVKYYGSENQYNTYTKIAQHLPRRNNRQVRERYACHLALDLAEPNRPSGYWRPEEDLRLLQLCSEYLKRGQKIDYAELNRKEFPQRNTHQLFSRFHRLRQKLSDDFYLNPINEEELKSKQIITTRKIVRKKPKPPKLPDDRKELFKYILRLSEQLRSNDQYDDDNNDDDDDDDEVLEVESLEKSCCPPKFTNVLTVLTKPKPNERPWTIDACLQLYTQLQPFGKFFQRRCVYDTDIDVRTTNLMRTVLLELLDFNIQENLCEEQSKSSSLIDLNSKHDDKVFLDDVNDDESITKRNYPVSPLTLDTIRFYLMNISVSINSLKDHSQIRCLFMPNFLTMYGYALMQLLFNSMLIRSAECNYNIDDEDSITEQEEFKELRSIFASLFLWPALLSKTRNDDDEDQCFQQILSQRIVESNRTKQESSNKTTKTNIGTKKSSPLTTTIVEVPSNSQVIIAKRRGRPRKREFYKPINDFLKIRSIQREIFHSNLLYSDFGDEHYRISSKFWIQEPRSSLAERVRMFLEHIQLKVEMNMDKRKQVKRQKTEEASKEKYTKRIGISKHAIRNNQSSSLIEPSRRSIRLSSKYREIFTTPTTSNEDLDNNQCDDNDSLEHSLKRKRKLFRKRI